MENKKNIGWGFENKEDDNYGILIICYFSIFISGSLLFLICLYIYCTMRKKKNDRKIKKLCIRHHTNKMFYRSVYFCLVPVQVGTHIISYVKSHSFYKIILKICSWVCDEE